MKRENLPLNYSNLWLIIAYYLLYNYDSNSIATDRYKVGDLSMWLVENNTIKSAPGTKMANRRTTKLRLSCRGAIKMAIVGKKKSIPNDFQST